jgi:hypothetical protein
MSLFGSPPRGFGGCTRGSGRYPGRESEPVDTIQEPLPSSIGRGCCYWDGLVVGEESVSVATLTWPSPREPFRCAVPGDSYFDIEKLSEALRRLTRGRERYERRM